MYTSRSDSFPHIDYVEAGDEFHYCLKFIFPVQLVFVRTQYVVTVGGNERNKNMRSTL